MALWLHASPVQAQLLIEDRTFLATDSLNGKVFLHNPAAVVVDKFWISYARHSHNLRYQVDAVTGQTVDKRTYNVSETNHGIGLLAPLGSGTAVGINGQYLGRDVSAQSEARGGSFKDEFRRKHAAAHMVVDLTAALRVGFGYRLTEVNADLRGSFDVNDNDRTRNQGKTLGYVAGLYYDVRNWGSGRRTPRHAAARPRSWARKNYLSCLANQLWKATIFFRRSAPP